MSTISASTTSTTAYKVTADTTGTLVLQTGATPTTAMTIDGSQNVGMGVTPSAWSGYKVFEFTIGGVLWSPGAAASRLGSNYYYNGTNFIYKASNAAADYRQNTGAHEWHTAASGTAGNAITFTQAMTLDSSGRLGIGTTSPAQKLDVVGSAKISNSDTTQTTLFASNSAGSTEMGVFPSGIGYYGTISNTALAFYSNSSERARIDSSGNLLVGAATQISTEKFGVTQATNNIGSYVIATDSSTYTSNVLLLRGNRNTTNATWSFLRCYNNADKLYIYDSGNVVNANNSYGAISDIKLKENIADATPKLADLMQVRVRSYNMKNDPDQKHLGVIAQELEEVFPSMIQESPDQDIDGNDLGTTTKTVKYSVFVPMLIKAIQEQQAIITTLTARIEALENK